MPVPELREYQTDLYHRVRVARGNGKRIIVLQAATGAGKTSVASFFTARSYELGKRSLLIAHRRKLVDQISDRLHQFEVPHGVIMRGDTYQLGQRVQVASRDTLLSRCVRNEWLGMPGADLVIVDEGHHCGPDSEYRRILDQVYPKATILLLTATPVLPDGSGLGPWAEAIECAAPTSQLVRDGYLVPVKCYAPERKKGRGNKYTRGIAGDLVESWQKYSLGMPTVLFCSLVKHSMDAVQSFRDAGITAAHVDADTEDTERERIFDEVASGRIKVVSNVGVISEGVDVPELGCCQLFKEAGGRVGFLQAVGRIMRPSSGKEHGVLIDHSGACFRHGFPDEDTEWTLLGNADEAFKKKHDAGDTEQAFYCKKCELAYHGNPACPQCGCQPAKPPRSIFAPPPVRPRNEPLVEADRDGEPVYDSREEKIRTWFACLNATKKRNGTFGQASSMYHRKYKCWPEEWLPCPPPRWGHKQKVADVYPNIGRSRQHEMQDVRP